MKYIQNTRKYVTKNNTALPLPDFLYYLDQVKDSTFCQQSDDCCVQFLGQWFNLGICPRHAVFPLFGFCVVKVPTWTPTAVYKTRLILYGEGKVQSF